MLLFLLEIDDIVQEVRCFSIKAAATLLRSASGLKGLLDICIE